MPGNTRPLCKQNRLQQTSTYADGTEKVIRDIEQLISCVNQIIACQSAVSDTIDSVTNGSFGGGSGSTSSTSDGGATGTGATPTRPAFRLSTGVDFSLPDGFVGVALVDPTADVNVTLPYPVIEHDITIINVNATHKITVKDNAGTVLSPTIMAGGKMILFGAENSSNTPAWSGGLVQYPSGAIVVAGHVNITTSDGLRVTSPDGTYWVVNVSNTGVVSTTSTASTSASIV